MRADRLGIALLLAALAVPPVVGDDRTATVGWPDNVDEASPVADHPVADKAKHEAEHDTSAEHEDEDEDEDEDEPNITPVNLSVTLLGILTFLIAVTVIFEEAKERIVHSASDRMRPVVDTLFSEMTVLGFLSLVTFSVSKLGVLPSLSTSIFGDGKHNEEYLEELLEMVHYALFLVMVIFVSVVLLMVAGAGALEVKWNDWNKMASEGDAALKQHILRLMSRPNRRVSIAIELAEFTALRKECIDAREVLPPFACRAASHSTNIPEDFNFGKYLSYALAHFLTETVEVPPSTWSCLWVLVALFYGASLLVDEARPGLCVLWVLFGYALFAATAGFEKKVHNIRDGLTNPAYVRDLLSVKAEAGHGLLSGSLPAWTRLSLPDRGGALASRFLGKAPNRQHMLFWFGENGAQGHLFLMRSLFLLLSVYGSLLALVFGPMAYSEVGATSAAVYALVGIVPLVYTASRLKPLLTLIVLVGSIGTHEHGHFVKQVLREQKTTRAMKCLLLLSNMRIMALSMSGTTRATKTPSPKRSSASAANDDALASLTSEQREHVESMFDLYDTDGQGSIDSGELKALLASLGCMLTDEEALAFLRVLDADGNGSVEKDEFLSFQARQIQAAKHAPPTVDELVDHLFSIFDGPGAADDGGEADGAISVGEFRAVLDRVNSGLTPDDITDLVRELDHDHSGTISKDEFKQLVVKMGELLA